MAIPCHTIVCLCVLVQFGCAPTLITTNRPNAQIYVDGRHAGSGKARLDSLGPPNEVEITVVDGAQTEKRLMKRQFRTTTFLVGLFTLYTGLYWAWRYPEEVTINMPDARQQRPAHNPWTHPLSAAWHSDDDRISKTAHPPVKGAKLRSSRAVSNPWASPKSMVDSPGRPR